MTGKIEVSRSQAVRDYLKSVKPSERGPKAVSEALKLKGVEVSPGLVSQVKSSFYKKKKTSLKISTKSTKLVENKKKNSSWETWILAKNLLRSVGGNLSEAKKNLEIISRLLS